MMNEAMNVMNEGPSMMSRGDEGPSMFFTGKRAMR
jgi:hypothetical protein